ncbi:hypothetical protein KUTeg_007067 [Tegillarca granosa]|uniref:Uncharacterized protein n=1 Tax=Tegillarca granosa TaxID=220873 RepID=A0ABQ9FC61_TEGGR|nr:hypothetical protein KUTeg_007067 [Tegillarca granosa]
MEAELERARSEYKRNIEEGHPVVPLVQMGNGKRKLNKDRPTTAKVQKVGDKRGGGAGGGIYQTCIKKNPHLDFIR